MADDTARPRAIYGTGGLFQTRLRGELVWCSQKSVMLDGRRRYARGYGRTPVEATQRRDANYGAVSEIRDGSGTENDALAGSRCLG